MENQYLKIDQLRSFKNHLQDEERSKATIDKYLFEVTQFSVYLDGKEVTKTNVSHLKEHLIASGYAPSTVNGKLTAIDRFLDFIGRSECKVKHLKLQRRLFRDDTRELTKREYERLIETAKELGKQRLSLLMEAICSTGIRVSEVQYLTVEAAQRGKAEIRMKGKLRTILIPKKLCRKLLKYAKKHKTASGEILLTRGGKSISRKQIWVEMKALCKRAGVAPSKVFPHNLRHLFARTFYHVCRDIAKLADVLGHSSVETTRIYLISTGAEHAKTLDLLQLMS